MIVSVPTWKRKVSSAEYLWQTYMLNVRLGQILVNKPQKYKTNYTDKILRTALDALENVMVADSIFLSKGSLEQDFLVRRHHLQLAKGQIESVATMCYIMLELVRNRDYMAALDMDTIEKRVGKLSGQELEIGEMCESCYKLISALMRSDAELYRKYIKPRQADLIERPKP